MQEPTLRTYYPAIKPFDTGMLDVGDGHQVYREVSGNPKGKPALFLHGGPGGSCQASHRQLFNPKKFKIVMFDQRGCGRSLPFCQLKANTTQHLVGDIEKLRKLLGIDRWKLVLGGSWGSTLALAYAEKFPKLVQSLVLRGIFTARKQEIDWYYQSGASFLFPEAWEKYVAPLSKNERKDIVASYRKRLTSSNMKRCLEAARAWAKWEFSTSRLINPPLPKDSAAQDRFYLAFSGIENHYFVNKGFMKEGALIIGAKKLAKIPGVIIQGRYDCICPVTTAWDLHKQWPQAKYVLVPNAGHSASEPGILDATIHATDYFAR